MSNQNIPERVFESMLWRSLIIVISAGIEGLYCLFSLLACMNCLSVKLTRLKVNKGQVVRVWVGDTIVQG